MSLYNAVARASLLALFCGLATASAASAQVITPPAGPPSTPRHTGVKAMFKDLYDQDLTTKNQDYSAATAGFMNGQGGVYLVGTWMIDTYDEAAAQPGSSVNRVRSQSQLHPIRLSCERMRGSYCPFHCQMRSNRMPRWVAWTRCVPLRVWPQSARRCAGLNR